MGLNYQYINKNIKVIDLSVNVNYLLKLSLILFNYGAHLDIFKMYLNINLTQNTHISNIFLSRLYRKIYKYIYIHI